MTLSPDFRHRDLLIKALPGSDEVSRQTGTLVMDNRPKVMSVHFFSAGKYGSDDACTVCGRGKDHPIHKAKAVPGNKVEKHGNKGDPGYRLLHPGRKPGASHRPESRGLSGRFANALNVNMKPRPLSGQKKAKGRGFKSFMATDRLNRREAAALGPFEQRKRIAGRLNPDQMNALGNPKSATGVGQPAAPRPRTPVPSMPGVAVAPLGSLVRTGEGPNFVAVDVDPAFNDIKAMDIFLDTMKDDKGRPMFDPAGGNRLLVENDPDNAPLQRFIRHAKRRGIDVVTVDQAGFGTTQRQGRRGQMLEAMDRMIEAQKGRGFVVGFRPQGNTVGFEGDLIDQHLKRGVDSRGNVAEAVVIQPGYRGKKDAEGLDDDSAAFMLVVEDVVAVGGPKAKPSKKLDAIIFAPEAMPPKQGGQDVRGANPMSPPSGADIDGPYNLADTPAGQHIAAGGDVWDAPNEGLAWFIIHNPHRFEPLRLKGGGISASFGIRDRKTGRLYFLKQAEEGGAGNMRGDGANEVLIAQLAEAIIPGRGLQVRYADDPNLRKTWIISEHIDEKFGKHVTPARPFTGPLNSHNEWFALHMLDFVMNQSDRHHGNWMEEPQSDGSRRLVIIDHGAAGLGHIGIRGQETYSSWLNGGRAWHKQYIGKELKQHYNRRRREIERDFDGIMKVMLAVDVDALVDRAISDNDLQGREEAYMRTIGAMWKKRLAQLKSDRADVITALGGQ